MKKNKRSGDGGHNDPGNSAGNPRFSKSMLIRLLCRRWQNVEYTFIPPRDSIEFRQRERRLPKGNFRLFPTIRAQPNSWRLRRHTGPIRQYAVFAESALELQNPQARGASNTRQSRGAPHSTFTALDLVEKGYTAGNCRGDRILLRTEMGLQGVDQVLAYISHCSFGP